MSGKLQVVADARMLGSNAIDKLKSVELRGAWFGVNECARVFYLKGETHASEFATRPSPAEVPFQAVPTERLRPFVAFEKSSTASVHLQHTSCARLIVLLDILLD